MLPIIHDLDELVIAVRNPRSREYITEAVLAYRARAFRAAVVAAWIAVVFDIIEKIREVSGLGDKKAIAEIKQLDQWIANGDVQSMQKFESAIVELAESGLQIITEQEATELNRLRDDRNRCAHPAFSAEGTLFVPSAEQVRAHVVHACLGLLLREPTQGKAAIDALSDELKRPSFPLERDAIKKYLRSKYLVHARESLVRNLAIFLIKAIAHRRIQDPLEKEKRPIVEQLVAALEAVAEFRPEVFREVVREKMNERISSSHEPTLTSLFAVLARMPFVWDELQEHNRLKLVQLAKAQNDFMVIHEAAQLLDHPSAHDAVVTLLATVSDDTLLYLAVARPRREFAARLVNLMEERTRGWRESERVAAAMVANVEFYDRDQVRRILEAATTNEQIYDASGLPKIMLRFYEELKGRPSNDRDAWHAFGELVANQGFLPKSYDELLQRLRADKILPPAPPTPRKPR